MSFYHEYVTQTSIVRGTNSITSASNAIIKGLSIDAKNCSQNAFDAIKAVTDNPSYSSLNESDLEEYFRIGYYNKLCELLGDSSSEITSSLGHYIDITEHPNISILPSPSTKLSKKLDNTGKIIEIRLLNVTIAYEDPVIGSRTDTLSYVIEIPDVTFYTGNDELFDYCMVAKKGIYITGSTSSILGDIYAGRHTIEESRDSEKIYGEVGTYGGLNVLSTQLGVNANKIICDGDFNINGSFVILSGENDNELICYGERLNDLDSFSQKAMYSLDGIFYSTTKNNERTLNDFYSYQNTIFESMSKLGDIEIYYDTANAEGYAGAYRVIMSNSDIEIKNDVTGIVMTPCNVIIGNDVNVEGLIICGDRIYARGNNNIVANKDVLRKIISFELNSDYGMKAFDYLGGIAASGITDPDYYVIPYR